MSKLYSILEDLVDFYESYFLHPKECDLNLEHPDEDQEFECSCGFDNKFNNLVQKIKDNSKE